MEPKELYDNMVRDGLYTKSYDDFKAKYGSEEGQRKLHSMMRADGLYTKDFDSFRTKYFSPAEAPVKKKVSGQDSAFDWETGSVDTSKLSSAPAPAQPAAGNKQQVVTKDGVEMDWNTGEVKQSAFHKNTEKLKSVEAPYELVVSSGIGQPSQDEGSGNFPEEQPKKYSLYDVAVKGMMNSQNKGFIGDNIGGMLKGAGELVVNLHQNVFDDPTATVDKSWFWQAGNALQGMFRPGGVLYDPVSEELQQTDFGQINSAIGQMGAMVLTSGASLEGQAIGSIPKSAPVLKEAAKQFFSRPSVMGAMQMVDQAASDVRNDKAIVDSTDRDTYIEAMKANGADPELAGRKYDTLKNNSAEDLIAEMLPSVMAAGATESIPVAGWFSRANKATGGSFGRIFMEKAKDVAVGTFEGAAQEALQQWMTNASAKEIYDFTKESTEGVWQSAKVGGGAQLVFEILGTALGVKLHSTGDKKVQEALDLVKAEEKKLAASMDAELIKTTTDEDVAAALAPKVEAGEITKEEAAAQVDDISAKRDALEKLPEEHIGNPEVLDALAEKTKIDKQIEEKKESIKGVDDSLAQDTKDEIAKLETESAKASMKVAEAAGVKPDEKAVKKLEGDDSSLPRVGKMVVDPKTQEMYPEGKPDERKPLSGKTAKEYADLRIDDNAKVQDADTEGLSPEETRRKVLEEGSPKQVGQLWQSEPDIDNPLDESNPNSRNILIRDAVAANKFSDESIGRSKFSGKELDNVKKKFGGGKANASELAESMSDPESGDYLGIGEVTEEDIFDALEANMNEGVPSVKSKPNPAKKEAAKRFKKLTGIAPTNEYVDRLTQRSDKIAEESAIESHYDTVTGDISSPPNNIGETVKRAVFERIMLDPTKSEEEKADIKSRGLTRESLSNKYVNEIADTTIDGAMQAMGFDAALEATVEASKDMKQKRLDAVYSGDSQALADTEVNEALASMLLQKVAHIYSVNGNVQKAGDVYEIADRLGLGAGQFIQSLSEQATPEAVANRLTSKALTEQKKVLRRMGAKGETIMDLIANLKEQVRVSREEARTVANESAVPSAKKAISEKKAAVKKKKSDAIASIKEKWANMQAIGAVNDPKIEAEKQAQLLESVVDLAKAYIEEGVVNVQELFNNIVETLRGIGIANPDSVAKQAILSVHGEKNDVKEQPKGTPQKLMDVPLRSTVSPEKINALEFKEQPKGAQVSSHGIDEGDITIGSFVANADMEVEGLVEKYANGELDRALWVELMGIGLSEKDAKAMERSVKNSVKNIRANKVRKAISQFKSKMDENGLVGNKKKWNESVDKLVDAFNGVNMTDDSILSALSGYFGYPDITSEDVKKIADIASAISASFSPELKARNSHELAIFMRRMKKKHSFWTTMAEEFNSLTVMGALNGVGTIANVIQGSVLTLAPKLAALAISSPIATRAALKAFKDANAKNIRMGWGALIDGFKNNVSAIETHGENHTDKYGGRASLVEDAILTGMKRYYEKAAKAKGEGKYGLAAKEATKFMWSTIMQPIRVAFLLKGIDGAFTHPIAEVVRYVETFNKLASEKGFGAIDFKNKLGDEFLGEVADYGKFRPEHWESARQQAAMEVGVMRAKGEEIPPGFELRRSKEIIYEQVKADEIKSALQFMKESLIMGDPTGALGTAYRAVQSKLSIREDTGPVKAWAKAIMNVVTGLFMRVSVNSANFVWNSSPGFLPQLSNAAVSYARTGHVFAKYVGEASAKKAPQSRQLEASGWVRLSDTEITQRVLLSAVSNAALSILFADMFDWDDEKKRLVLDPDRHFDVSLTLGGSFNPSDESADMKQMSIRFRWDKSQEFGSGSGYVMALPFMPAFSIIGGLRDDAIYRPDNMQFDSKPGMVGSVIRRGYWDILTGISQMSFNSIGQLITSETRAVAAAQKASAEGRDPLSEIGAAQAKILSRPLKTALQTNFYRDLYNEFGAMMDADAKKPANVAEEMMKDVWLLDMFIDGSRTDEYGNVLKRESKMAKIAESFTMNAVDFVQANEEVMSRPEWKLRKKFPGVTTSGAYRPSKDMKIDKKPVSEDDKKKIAQLFLDINGQTVRENYDYLNSLDADEYKDALNKIRSYAIEKAKDEVVPTKARPKLHLKRKKKGADN